MYHDVLRDDNVEAAPWEHYSSYKFASACVPAHKFCDRQAVHAELALQALPSPKQNTLVGQPTGFEHPAPNTGRTVYLLKLQNASAITVLVHLMTSSSPILAFTSMRRAANPPMHSDQASTIAPRVSTSTTMIACSDRVALHQY